MCALAGLQPLQKAEAARHTVMPGLGCRRAGRRGVNSRACIAQWAEFVVCFAKRRREAFARLVFHEVAQAFSTYVTYALRLQSLGSRGCHAAVSERASLRHIH